MTAPAAWMPDPSGRHELRYWDGSEWTEHVSDQGQTATEALEIAYPAPVTGPPGMRTAGAAMAPAASGGVVRRSGRAVASLVLGIVGIFIFPIICSTLAIVFGALAMRDVRENPNLTGKGMAQAGLILGIIGLVFGVAFIIYLAVR